MLVALIPGATAVLLYVFLGGFYAGHLLLAASIMAVLAGVLRSVKNQLGAAEQRDALS
jgi:hypothetical protein